VAKPAPPLTINQKIIRKLPLIVQFRAGAIALISGVVMGLTVAPVNAWFLAWLALVPLWVGIVPKATSTPLPSSLKNPGHQPIGFDSPGLMGFLWGIGYHGLALSWIRDLHPLTWLGISWWGSVAITFFAWSFITLLGGSFGALWSWGMRRFWILDFRFSVRSKPNLLLASLVRVLFGATLWCVLEWVWSHSPLWWTSLTLTQSPHNLAILHLGQLSGPNTITAAIVAVNGLFAEAWLRLSGNTEPSKPYQGLQPYYLLIGNITLLSALHGWGFALYSQPLQPAASPLTIGIIQGNIPTRIKLAGEGIRRALTTYTQGYRHLADQGVEAVLTPEGAFPWYWLGGDRSDSFSQALREKKILVWLGTPGLRDGKITQSLFTITGDGTVLSRYDKLKLVPLGEYLPFESLLGKVISRLSPVELSMVPGHTDQQFNTPFGQAIVAICFDSAFSEVFRRQAARGGEFILTASNNDPYGRAMMAQHYAQDVMRAIETDRWAVRATNTGLSGVIDPHGNRVWVSGFRTYDTHIATIDRRQTKTLYVRWGDWLTPTLMGVTVVGWMTSRRHNPESRSKL